MLERELLLIEKHKIHWITHLDETYPQLLKNIHIPPTVLYWQGTLPAGQNAIAIVGARAANAYGKQVIEQLVPPLVAHNWVIVSGGALGADTMAHQATLKAQGITVAVLGSGLLQPYPPENIRLFETIIQNGGAVVSPFPLLMEPLPGNFPARNRVIAGLSRGCIVIQAATKSGARITADYCLSQGRDVFAIPGSIYDPLSVGCHALIKQGATVITKAEDILAEYGQEIQPQDSLVAVAKQAILPIFKPVEPVNDTSIEGIMVRACQNPCAVDELLELTGLPLIQITKLLFDLQLKGLLSQNMSGLWENNKSVLIFYAKILYIHIHIINLLFLRITYASTKT